MGEKDPALAMKCLEICQTLIAQGKAFKLTVGSDFSFSLDTRGEAVLLDSRKTTIMNTIKETVAKKKLSPSAKRRNQKRRDEFLKKKRQTCSEKPEEEVNDKPPQDKKQMNFNCDLCDFSSKTKRGVSVHMGHAHKVETLRGLSLDKSLEVSLSSEERENENTSTPVKTKTSELEKSETFGDQLMESLIPCDSCVALFENEEDMKDHLTWCRDTWVPYLKNRSLPGASLDLSTH